MDDIYIREFTGDDFGRIHEAKGGGEDHIEAFAGQRARDLFGISAFCHVLDVSSVHAFQGLLHVQASHIMRLRPTTVVMRSDIYEGDIVAAFDRGRHLVVADCF